MLVSSFDERGIDARSLQPDYAFLGSICRYQRGNRNRKSKKDRQQNGEKKQRQKDKQRSTKHTHKIKDRVTRTPLKTGCELRCLGMV